MNQSTLQNRMFAIEALTETIEDNLSSRKIRRIAIECYNALDHPLDDTIEIAVAVALSLTENNRPVTISAVMKAFGGKVSPQLVQDEIDRQAT